jgi:hypothetical protein
MFKHAYQLAIVLAFAGSLLGQEPAATAPATAPPADAGQPAGKMVEPAATFIKADEKTSGNWKGVYGAEGAIIFADADNAPKYATVTPGTKTDYVWAESTDEGRAPQKSAADAKDRVAACWEDGTAFDIDINLTDGAEHQVAVYCLDWDRFTRTMTIEVQNADTGAKLDSQDVKDFADGKYLIWKLQGHVKLHITNTGPVNAVVSGILFDPVAK